MTDRALLLAAERMDMRVTPPDAAGVCTVTCRACGWVNDAVMASVYARQPHPCLRCHADDWRPIGEIAKDILRRVRGRRHG